MTDQIRDVVRQHARLAVPVEQIPDDGDLYAAGLTSHASVNLMLALESAFDVEFPERMLRRRAFESIAAIRSALEELRGNG
ncbi:MAG: acyl carrier protein [Deltaproteobacteria bacterium]|nr:acyl carrier protein [Deltaproteobacteria bacterium]